jgi:hypothetical protein
MSSKQGACGTPTLSWKKTYLDSFLATVSAREGSLRDGYAGHNHINDFRVFTDVRGTPYLQTNIIPSVSPDHHDPEFEIGVYDQGSGALVDYAVVYLKNSSGPGPSGKPDWETAYDFRQLSTLPSYSPANLKTISLLLRSNGAIRSKPLDLFATHMSSAISLSARDWLPYSCAQTEITSEAFTRCRCPLGSSTP